MSAAFVRFSIIIPVYNRDEPLRRALLSVARQTFGNYEAIVVDDGSDPAFSERIQTLVNTLDDSRFSLISYQPNRNGAYARNCGIEVAQGEYLCLLDSDDEWLPEKLTCIDQALQKNAHGQVIHHSYQNVINGVRSAPFPQIARRIGESVAEYSFCTNRVGGIQSSCLIVKRELAQRVRFNDTLRGHQDWDFALRLGAETDHFLFIDQVLTLRHVADAASGMVSRSLDYAYSLTFLREYQKYFSWRAQAGYTAHILLPKKIISDDNTFTRYEWLMILFHPLQFAKYKIKQFKLHLRCVKLLLWCRLHKKNNLALMGCNDYTKFFIKHYASGVSIKLLIDKNKKNFGVRAVFSVGEISEDLWTG